MNLMIKQVGKRKPFSGNLSEVANFLKLVIRLREGNPFIPKGVYKFKSHKEAQEWTLKMLTRKT